MKLRFERAFSIRWLKAAGPKLLSVLCMLTAAAALARAQSQQLPPPPLPEDPTPLSELLSAQESAQVADADNPKKLIETYLKISDAHLELAYSAINSNDSRTSVRELDIYSKAIAEAGKVAFAQPKDRRRLAKKIEQKLYKQLKTLELIERMFPEERMGFAESAHKKAKQLRVQALNEAFAGGEILDDPTTEKKPAQDTTSDTSGDRSTISLPVSYLTSARRAAAQVPGDYLTEEEDEFVRTAQDPDMRVRVFMKIADRRLVALAGPPPVPADKKAQEKAEQELRRWGALPKLERTELLRHYARAISEVMAKLEDAYERNPKSSALPKALTILRDATEKHIQILRQIEPEMKSDQEVAAFRRAIDEAETAYNGAREGLKGKEQ